MADSREPPSGRWMGYYLYAPTGPRNRQSLRLSFSRGKLSGDGSDGVGAFSVDGEYDTGSSTVRWVKSYLGMHSVNYHGYHERRVIWGRWTIDAQCHGGFKLWPIALGNGDPHAAEKAAAFSSAFLEHHRGRARRT